VPRTARTVRRDDLVAYLDRYLRTAEIPDSSPNGLQVQGADRVTRIAYAVDVSVQTIRAAEKVHADFLVVHHGLWWGKHTQITGTMHARVAGLIHAGMSLYAAHLPLDCHPAVGNNVELARLMGLRVQDAFGDYRGTRIGVVAASARPQSLAAFATRAERVLEAPVRVHAFGSGRVRRVAIVSGGGAMLAEEAARAGCDTLLTGETSHSSLPLAREAGIHLVFGGHYATETVGLRALERHIAARFKLPGTFLPAPTGY
jgi:dinuclear metal center YbgI/SA1388 family protein